MEVVMPVPFQPGTGNARLIGERAHDALHGAGQRRSREGNTVAEGVAETDLDGHGRLTGQVHQLAGERQAKAIDVGAGHVFEVAAGDDAPFQSLRNDPEIVVHGLFAGFAEFEKDVVVGHAGKQPDFVELHVPGDFQVLQIGPDPARDAGETVAARPANLDGLAVFLGIHKKFRSLNKSAFAAQLVQKVIDAGDLLDCIGRTGLLAVAEGRVGDEHGIGRTGARGTYRRIRCG